MRKPGNQEARKTGSVKFEHEALTAEIIGSAIQVHTALGPGYVESVYENALALEMEARRVPFQRQLSELVRSSISRNSGGSVLRAGCEVGRHRLDLFVADLIVAELKAIKAFEPIHFAVARSYLRALGRRHGLLLNFAPPTLQIMRVLAQDWPSQ